MENTETTTRKTATRQNDTQRTASELIELLRKGIAENGDLPVRFTSNENADPQFGDSHPAVGFVTMMDDSDKPDYFMIGDDAMIDAMN